MQIKQGFRAISLNDNDKRINIYFFIFALSGASGLIYESIWTHYLKLFLGHAAYAQTLVLGIFMGGMAIGAALAGRFSHRLSNVLKTYALIEGLIGIAAIAFHGVYVTAMDVSYQSIFPALGSATAISTFKWGLAALIILPQSILLGSTFPFMSAGIIRRFPAKPGRTLALLYFNNSFGAALGVLASGFILIPAIGLPGTIQFAGIINLCLAFYIWHLSLKDGRKTSDNNILTPSTRAQKYRQFVLLGFLIVSATTGAASFLYEIAWIRMLSMVLGSTTHAFELMLSAFIFGLAIGGYYVHSRIDRLRSPLQYLGWIQLAMGVLAICTLIVYGSSFKIMSLVVNILEPNSSGYLYFNLISHGIALMVMLPATICAGMTLPLITYQLLRMNYGESSIGNVYASNTIGAIVGIVLAVQWLMPGYGLKAVISVGSGLDILLGVLLLVVATRKLKLNLINGLKPVVPALIVYVAILVTVQLDPIAMASGVYTTGQIRDEREIISHTDGKTASISVFRNDHYLAVSTNGKTEAALSSKIVSKDEPTMILLGLLPQILKPQAKDVAIIGIGSGLTSHSLLLGEQIESSDTIEIEPAMVEAAKLFGNRVSNTFNDHRSHIHIDDAKAFFTNYGKRYDLIISEPSNPWVSGVAGLFSNEFYRLVHNHIADDGLLVQWIHLYHISPALVASVVKAMSPHFSDYAIYALNLSDIAIIATKSGQVPTPQSDVLAQSAVREELARIGINSITDIDIRLLGTKKDLDPYFDTYAVPANSDYFPFLDYSASRARFLRSSATELLDLALIPAAILEFLGENTRKLPNRPVGENHYYPVSDSVRLAQRVDSSKATHYENEHFQPFLAASCSSGADARDWMRSVHVFADGVLPYFSNDELAEYWGIIAESSCLNYLTVTSQRWIRLYAAMSRGDASQVASTAELLLPEGQIESNPENNYLVAVASAANHALHLSENNHQLFQRFVNSEHDIPLLRYVYSKIEH